MSETYADDYQPETLGGFIVVALAILTGILVLAGLFYATGAGARHKAALAINDCEPSLSPSGLPCNTQQMVIGQYQAIVTPVGKQLNGDMLAYRANEKRHLAAAEAALMSEVSTEQGLSSSLAAVAYTNQNYAKSISLITVAADDGVNTPSAAILLTPQTTAIADALIRANQALSTLTAEQAKSTSLRQLQSFNSRVAADNTIVVNDIKAIGKDLAAPITAAQEP
jgi:hypothetical protein